jgi:hypothetical protein
MKAKMSDDEVFAEKALRRVWDIENGIDSVDFSERTARVCIAHMRQDLALLCFGVARAREHLIAVRNLLMLLILMGVFAIFHWW